MADIWLLIKVEDSILRDSPLGDGVKLRYMVSPHLQLTPETRSETEVVNSAVEAGFEASYCSSGYPGVPPWVWSKIELKVIATLRETLKVNVREFAVSITLLVKLAKYSPR